MRCPAFEPLTTDMNNNHIDKEHFTFVYNKLQFDVILSIVQEGYEILIAIHTHNWGCVLKMNEDFYVEMPDRDYFALCKVLKLNWSKDHFNSSAFLTLLSNKAPRKSMLKKIDYRELRPYLPYRKVDESEKIYFCGWNDHIKDKRTAHNFDKTEYYLGKSVADYCRTHNISSLWTNVRNDEKLYLPPWAI